MSTDTLPFFGRAGTVSRQKSQGGASRGEEARRFEVETQDSVTLFWLGRRPILRRRRVRFVDDSLPELLELKLFNPKPTPNQSPTLILN